MHLFTFVQNITLEHTNTCFLLTIRPIVPWNMCDNNSNKYVSRFSMCGGLFGRGSLQLYALLLTNEMIPWQYCVCCIISGVTRCTLLMVLYLDRMCQCGLHAVLWSHIGTLIRRLAAEPRSTAGLLYLSQCPSGTILLTPYSMVWDWLVLRARPILFYWPKLLYPYYNLPIFFSLSSLCL